MQEAIFYIYSRNLKMTRIKYDVNLMKFISLFESITRARVKDCISKDERLIFIVQPGEMGKAIGKKGSNIKKLEKSLKKKIRIIEFDDEVAGFVSNCIYPSKAKDIEEREGKVMITPEDNKARGYIIGRGGINLRELEDIVSRFFEVDEIKVV
ncbi:NusA-like transcription termination signal-binding factor [Candidatus Woesearchaeota archaeon]|nr:NusA-like transcription termination signal-binding factor [Candidatus Woesearchaeota archaeon]